MAVAPTGAIYKALKFDNVSSRNYGVYITGEAVYNAPERDIEMITIPGRNGTFALDNGRFENIEVSYPAGIYADTEADFRQAISDFRNFLCSRVGYVRLTDEYNPDEYRMAVYKSGLDVDPAQLRAGEFTITFDCKPQRWLVSGEEAVTVTSGDTLTNPTLFESGPLLEAEGEGIISFNGYEIDLDGVPYGEIVIGEHSYGFHSSTATVTLDTTLLNTGDAIYPQVKDCMILARLRKSTSPHPILNSIVSTTNMLEALAWLDPRNKDFYMRMYPDFGDGFVYGTSKTITSTAVFNYRIGANPESTPTYTETVQITIAYGGADTYTVDVLSTGTLPPDTTRLSWALSVPTMYGDSTKAVSGVPIYIDCDLGEAYIIIDDEYVSLNHRIDLGSDLPKLASGSNTVTFDNTITELKVTPRWWKV